VQINFKPPVVLQAGRNKAAAAARTDSGDVTVHVHDAGRDGFNRTKKLRWQASPDEDADSKNAQENNFPAARGGWRFWLHGFHAIML
jgi:hypothetical protein